MSNKGTHYRKLEKQMNIFWCKKLLKNVVMNLYRYSLPLG